MKKSENTSELDEMLGDPAAKFAVAEPALRSLHRSRIVYRERFIALIEVSDFKFNDKGIWGRAKPVHFLCLPDYARGKSILKGWTFGNTWDYTSLDWTETGYLRLSAPWCGWKIWPEAELVARIEAFAEKGEMQSALNLLGPSMFDI